MSERATRWVVVVAGFAARAGKVMLTQRMAGKHLAGAWEFPGGKLEPGETPEAALQREIREEIGVECRVGRLLDAVSYRYETFDMLMLLYRIDFDGEPRAIEVGDIGWYAPEAVAGLEVPPADLPLVARLDDYLRVS